jgi:ribulose bisphosphate carboxylase small subunit
MIVFKRDKQLAKDKAMKTPPRIYKAEATAQVSRFAGTGYEVRLSTNKSGRPQAHYWQRDLGRWLVMPRDVAELMLAEGRATQ